MTEPPGPPLPPSGPPRGLNFSRCTEATPLPPRPALTCSVTRSTKVGTAMPITFRWLGCSAHVPLQPRRAPRVRDALASLLPVSARSLTRDDVDDLATTAGAELDSTVDQREQGVVAATTDAVAGVEVRA